MIIGPSKYSKDPLLIPEGIALTLPTMFFEDRGMTPDKFKPYFERLMRQDDMLWNFKLTNLPLHDVAWVYLIFDRHIQYRLNFVQYERNKSKTFKDSTDSQVREFPNCNWVIMCGPPVKAPYEFPQKGFQGFRYTLKLF